MQALSAADVVAGLGGRPQPHPVDRGLLLLALALPGDGLDRLAGLSVGDKLTLVIAAAEASTPACVERS